jgi:hypothetical protein
MDIHFSCSHCEQNLVVDSAGAGETISCPACFQTIFVPLEDKGQKHTEPQLPVATSQQNAELDKIRYSARNLVESHWRNFLAMVDVNKRKALEAPYAFEATINTMMEHMPAPDASLFRSVIEEERDKLTKEYWSNPAALKARLGVINQTATHTYNRHSLDDLVVRTAVRATIWESIWAIFRLFR